MSGYVCMLASFISIYNFISLFINQLQLFLLFFLHRIYLLYYICSIISNINH